MSSLIKQGLHTKRDAGAEHSCTFSLVGRIRVEMNSSRNVVSMIHIHKLDGNRYKSIYLGELKLDSQTYWPRSRLAHMSHDTTVSNVQFQI